MACLKILALEGPYHQGKRIVYTVTLSTQKTTNQRSSREWPHTFVRTGSRVLVKEKDLKCRGEHVGRGLGKIGKGKWA